MRPLLSAALLAVCASCGYVGPPQPPALNIPKPIADLRVSEVGDRIVVRFTPPVQTTEDLPVEKLDAIRVYAGPGEANFDRARWLSTARPYDVTVSTGEIAFEIPAADFVGQQIIVAARTTGRTGKNSDLSNYDFLNVAPPLQTPSAPAVTNTAEGVALQWTGNAPRYRILRTILNNPDAQPVMLAEVDANNYLDATATTGARYRYSILGISGEDQSSLASAPVEIAPADTFPPAAPTGLTAIASANSIDLSWSRNSEDDLAGYSVFRALEDGPFERIAQNLSVPAFNDARAEAGKRYRYTVSATDMAGNESGRSSETSAQIE